LRKHQRPSIVEGLRRILSSRLVAANSIHATHFQSFDPGIAALALALAGLGGGIFATASRTSFRTTACGAAMWKRPQTPAAPSKPMEVVDVVAQVAGASNPSHGH